MGHDPVHSAIPDSRYGERLVRAQELVRERGVQALLIGHGADLRYLTGYQTWPTERLTMLVIPAKGDPFLVAPALEAMAAAGSPAGRTAGLPVVAWGETDDPYALVTSRLGEASASAAGSGGPVLISDRLWAMHVLASEKALPGVPIGLASTLLRELRMIKDPHEIALLRQAAHAADRVVTQIAAGRLVGRTEADVSAEVRDRLVAEGHETADFAIVASGPNSASPHHEAGGRVIAPGDPIVLDIGGTLGGYCSDTTRTLWVTGEDPARGPTPEFRGLYEILQAAQAAATATVRPGIPCEQLDAVARGIISAGGHGPEFIHRLGHGIGLETHEEPYLVTGNAELLREGTAFSVEPGIYQAGRYGARIEDIVVCGPTGPDVLNQSDRDLWVVPG